MATTQRSTPPPGIAIGLIGGLSVTGPRSAIPRDELGRRATVVLARLALAGGQPVTRQSLADAVWGDPLPRSWPAALRNVVSEVRRGLDRCGIPAALFHSAADDGYLLRLPADAHIDVVALRHDVEGAEAALHVADDATAAAAAERCLAVTTREVLPGHAEPWIDAVRLEVADLRIRALAVSAQAALALGDAPAAERRARTLVAIAPLREDGHRLLMRSLAADGNNAAALDAYAACRRVLRERLGASPSRPTEDLFLSLLGERPGAAQPSRARPAALIARPLLRLANHSPFVGREQMLARLRARLELARTAGPLVTWVSGEPGIGKSRLAAELAVRAGEDGVSVLYGRCEERLAVPYALWIDALAVHPDGVEADPARRYDTIKAGLRAAAGSGALVVLDDVHWATQAELNVVRALLTDPAEIPVLLLLLGREDTGAGAAGPSVDDPRVEALSLAPLNPQEIAELARLAGPADAADSAQQLWERSGGNALLATALLNAGLPDGAHSRRIRVEDLVRDRLARLPAGAESLLRVAAVAGTTFDRDHVARAAGLDEATATRLIDAALSAHLVVPGQASASGRLEFRHGLLRDALVEAMTATERAATHARLGAAVRADSRDPAAHVVAADHLSSAGGTGVASRAVHYALPVTRAAYRAGVYDDVVAIASRTLAILGTDDAYADARLDLRVLLGGAQRALGDPAGFGTLAAAFADAEERDDPLRMADAALALSHAGALGEEMFVDDQFLDLYARSLARLGAADPARRALLLSRLASGHAWRHSRQRSRDAVTEAIGIVRGLGDDGVTAAVLAAARRSATGFGDLAFQQEIERGLIACLEARPDPGLEVSTALWRYDTAVQLGEGSDLERLLHTAGRHAGTLQMGHYQHSLAYEYASLALLRGRVAEADDLVERAARIGLDRGIDPTVVQAIRLAQLLLVRFEQHRLGDLREEAAAFFEPAALPPWLGVVAYIDAETGRTDRVAERLDEMLADFARQGPTAICTVGLLALMANPVARAGDLQRIRRMFDLLRPYQGQGGLLAVFAGPVDYHLGLLANAAGNTGLAHRLLTSAAAFARRLGAPRWERRCTQRLPRRPAP